MKDRSVKHREVKTKATFSWAYRAELFKKDLLERVETWEISDKPIKRSVTEDEIDTIVRQIEEDWADDAIGGSRFKSLEARRFFRVREIAATLGLPETGTRVGEFFGARLCHLSPRDDQERRTIWLAETKNGDDRFAFLSKEYCDVAFEPWLEMRLKIETGNDYIFINENGGKIDPGAWGRQWNRCRVRAGIDRVIRRHDYLSSPPAFSKPSVSSLSLPRNLALIRKYNKARPKIQVPTKKCVGIYSEKNFLRLSDRGDNCGDWR